MNIQLKKSICHKTAKLNITGSKSETNRLLLLQALYPNINLNNISKSDDSDVMTKAILNQNNEIDIHHAGTAMRFLTAFFSIQNDKETIITGSSRMKERPIKILVDALKQLDVSIEYIENDGFPPIKIIGKKITKNQVTLQANVSSQYISALLLIAPKLENGLKIMLEGEITSIPYIKMTLGLLAEIGVKTNFSGNTIEVFPLSKIENKLNLIIESDWSSASYFYSIVAFSEIGTQITLDSFKKNSLQGDSALAEIYKNFGIETTFNNHSIILKKITNPAKSFIELDLNYSPDIAQTIAVTCFGLGIECYLTGLHTLKIKETDRLEALKTELTKFGASIEVSNDSLTLKTSKTINSDVKIATYQDHRMAMAFAPMALKTTIEIENAEVVSKSFPTFWEDLKSIGFDF